MKNTTKVNNAAKVKAHFLVNDRKMTKTDVAAEFGVSRRTLGRWLDEVEEYREKAKQKVLEAKQAEPVVQQVAEPVLPRPTKKVPVVYYRCTTTKISRHVQTVMTVNERLSQKMSDLLFAMSA